MPDKNKLYLETNALYSVNKIKPEYLEQAFTSSLAILELIAGLKVRSDRFGKTKSLLQSITNKLHIDWSLPQSVICFEMFDVSKPHVRTSRFLILNIYEKKSSTRLLLDLLVQQYDFNS